MSSVQPLALEDVDSKLRETLQPTVDRLGYFGEFFQYSAHAPAVLNGFMQYSGALRTALPDDLNEVIALTVCTHLGLAYERIQHERLSVKLGLDPAWIATLVGRSGGMALTPAQQAVRALSLAVVTNKIDEARAAMARVVSQAGEAVAVAALFQATRFAAVCTIGRLFDLQLPVTSIFEDEPRNI
jgi:hypothetical protein